MSLVTATPESAGLSASRLARIDGWMQRWVESGRLPGLSVLVHRRGETVYFATAGARNVATAAPMTDDTIFRIYSMTKPLTSVAILQLYEQGHFLLDDPISRVLPEFTTMRVHVAGNRTAPTTVPAERPITYRDLLTHTSGLTYGFMDAHPVDAMYRDGGVEFNVPGTATLAEVTTKLATMPLIAQPGRAWNYSVATDVLGRLVEAISGQPFDAYLRQNILAPLGMTDTDFHVPAEKAGRLAANYVRHPNGGLHLYDDPATSPFLKPPVLPSGGGGLVSTTPDYLRFCRMLLNGGALDGQRILGVKTVELMTSNHLGGDMASMGMPRFSESNYEGIGFGLGVSVMLDPARAQILGSEGEFAWGGMASTAFWCDPQEEMCVIMMTQLMPSSTYPIRKELRVLTYAAIED